VTVAEARFRCRPRAGHQTATGLTRTGAGSGRGMVRGMKWRRLWPAGGAGGGRCGGIVAGRGHSSRDAAPLKSALCGFDPHRGHQPKCVVLRLTSGTGDCSSPGERTGREHVVTDQGADLPPRASAAQPMARATGHGWRDRRRSRVSAGPGRSAAERSPGSSDHTPLGACRAGYGGGLRL
jgi:hypothetical protein